MGSVQVFPRRGPGSPLRIADRRAPTPEWRRAPAMGRGVVRVRESRLEDFGAVRALQRRVAPYAAQWALKQFESRRTAFPEGQLVAECDGRVVGCASALVVRWDDFDAARTLAEITAEGFLTSHDAGGETLYAAELLVGEGEGFVAVSRALLQARRRLCRRRNLARIIATARLPGYHERREAMTPEAYAMRVVWGELPDPWLRYLLSHGYQYCGIAHAFQPEDSASCGHAAVLAWLNPLHSPPGPPAFIQSDRPRKCA